MKLSQIRNLTTVAEHGSLKIAAPELGISERALLRSLRQLERELATPLFRGGRTALTLTPAGEMFVRRAAAAQLELDRASDEVSRNPGLSERLVSIGISPDQHFGLLPDVLMLFQERYPQVRLRVVEGAISKLGHEVRDGLLDLYVGPTGPNVRPEGLRIETLYQAKRFVASRTGHTLAGATSLAALAGARWIASSRFELDATFERHGLPRPSISVETESGLGMLSAAASSDALLIVSADWVEWIGRGGLLTVIGLCESLDASTVGLVTSTQFPPAPAAALLRDLITGASRQSP